MVPNRHVSGSSANCLTSAGHGRFALAQDLHVQPRAAAPPRPPPRPVGRRTGTSAPPPEARISSSSSSSGFGRGAAPGLGQVRWPRTACPASGSRTASRRRRRSSWVRPGPAGPGRRLRVRRRRRWPGWRRSAPRCGPRTDPPAACPATLSGATLISAGADLVRLRVALLRVEGAVAGRSTPLRGLPRGRPAAVRTVPGSASAATARAAGRRRPSCRTVPLGIGQRGAAGIAQLVHAVAAVRRSARWAAARWATPSMASSRLAAAVFSASTVMAVCLRAPDAAACTIARTAGPTPPRSRGPAARAPRPPPRRRTRAARPGLRRR